jgi:glycopeptide antibiotics resistance protein
LSFILEIIQGIFLIHRSFEVYDIFANVTGIILFIFLAKRVKKLLSNGVFL